MSHGVAIYRTGQFGASWGAVGVGGSPVEQAPIKQKKKTGPLLISVTVEY